MFDKVDSAAVLEFANKYCILMDYVHCNDFDFNSEEMKKKYSEWEGQYGYNAGVVSFVINGHYYATPYVEKALAVLKRANMKNTNIYVPFGGIFEFPYKLGPKETKRLWLSGYDRETGYFDAADRIIQYYQLTMMQNGTFRTWDRLLKESRSGDTVPLTEQINTMIRDIAAHRDEYNADAARELGIDLSSLKNK